MLTFLQSTLNQARISARLSTQALFWPLLLILVAAGSIAGRILFAPAPLTIDEGVHLAWARLLAAGYPPYTEVYLPVPPLWPLLLEIVWSFWPGVMALQIVLLMTWGLGIVAVALLGYELSGDPKAGLGAAFFLAFSEMYFRDAQPLLMEMPSVVAAILAVWLAFLYQRRGQFLALAGSALFTVTSLGLKLLAPFLPPLVLTLILAHHFSFEQGLAQFGRPEIRRKLLITGALWLGIFLFFPLLSFIWFDAQAMWAQMVGQRLDARVVYIEEEGYWASRFNRLAEYAPHQSGLIVMAILGLTLAFFHKLRNRWWLLAWFGLILMMLSLQTPLRYKHFLLLAPPMAVSAGLLLTLAFSRIGPARWLARGGLAIGLILFTLNFVGKYAEWAAYAEMPDPPINQRPAISFITEVTSPEDCLITDYAQLLFWSERLPPPELSELTSNRLRSGALTGPELIIYNQAYPCPVVAPLTGRLERSTPDYLEWVKAHYHGRFRYDNDSKLIYFAPALEWEVVRQTAVSYNIGFGSVETAEMEMELVAAKALPSTVLAGKAVPVTLFWQLHRLPAAQYTIFVQLRNAENVTVASADHQPYKSLLPFSQWPVGQTMAETGWLQLPAELPAGPYTLFIGLYNPQTLERLPILGDQSGENAVKLGTVQVQP